MMRKMSFIICGGLLLASTALAVSQVGGGKMHNTEQGFIATLPREFATNTEIFANGDVRLTRLGGFSGGFGQGRFQPRFEKISVILLQHSLPDVAKLADRADFVNWFVDRGWQSFAEQNDSCLTAFIKDSGTATTVAIGWGGGHGAVVVGESQSEVQAAISSMAKSIQLDPGACQWK